MADQLTAGKQLHVNDGLVSANGRVRLMLPSDGNLVLYRNDNGHALWASGTYGKPVNHAIMQSDGNFVCYGVEHGAVVADAGRPSVLLP